MSEVALLNDRYQLEERLGSGGMAVVYRARDLTLERKVAIKVLREDFSNDPAFRERFHQEAKAVANLSHTSIVTIHDFGLYAGQLFIVMEYVPGKDLKSIIVERSPFTIEETIPLMIQACAGIGYAHRAGLVHCDVKPQNMLVTPDKRLKVADFGIARALASIHPEEKSEVVWGSPHYFSPEQAAGAAPTPASDVYSLGVVMYEMLTGRLPFSGTTPTELSRQHRLEPPPPLSHFGITVPDILEQIITKVLSKEPSARYRTADQLGRVLMTFNRTITTTTTPSATHQEPTREQKASPTTTRPARQLLPPAHTAQPRTSTAREMASVPRRETNPLDIDWVTWGLLLLAVIAVLGLIPLWTWVFILYSR